MKINKEKLKNGSSLLTIELPDSPSVTFAVIIKSGPRFDPKNKLGISHFLEHLFFKGTKKYPDINIFNDVLEKNGVVTGAFSYQETNLYWAKGKSQNSRLIIEMLIEQIQNSLFRKSDINLEKEVVKEEMRILNDNPNSLIWELWAKNIWQGSSLGNNYVGNSNSIDSFKQRDIKKFFENNYSVDNTYFIIAGKISTKNVTELINKNLINYSNNKKAKIDHIFLERKNPINLFFQESSSITVAYGFLTTSASNEDSIILELIETLLGSGWGSLLRRSVFQAGLTYSIETYSRHLSDTGYLMNLFTCKKENLNKIIKLINNQLKMIVDKKLKKSDIERAKGYLTGSIILNNEKSDDVATWFAYQEVLNKDKLLLSPQEKCKLIEKISDEEIVSVAKKYFHSNNWYLSAIGPIKENEISVNFFA